MLNIENMAFGWEAESDCLQDVNLHIKHGEQWVITGENGAGKSTLLRLAAGLLKPSSGAVYLNGVDLAQLKSVEKSAQIGFLFQEVERQLFHSSVRDEICLDCGYSVCRRQLLRREFNMLSKHVA